MNKRGGWEEGEKGRISRKRLLLTLSARKRRACGLESRRRGALEEWRAYSFNACYQLLCISLLFRNSRKPPRLEPVARPLLSTASVSFLPGTFSFLSPLRPSTRCSLSAPDVLVPAASYPTRCFINENEGASYIFLTRPALVLYPSFFPSWISSFRHYCYHFPRRSRRPDGEYPHNPPHSPPLSLFAVTSTIARGSNITFRIPDRSPGNATTSSAQN